jgi:di/tricarboxylate transporter
LTPLPLLFWAMTGATMIVLTQCLRIEEAIQALDFNVLFLLIGTIPLGTAIVNTGLVDDLSALIQQIAGNNPYLLISVLYLLTNLITAVISNNAVAVLMTPLAISLAYSMGVDPKPLVMTVAFAASACLVTPQGYQTNIIVMGPAGYKYSDFIRVGLPLSIVLWIVSSLLIPILYPL